MGKPTLLLILRPLIFLMKIAWIVQHEGIIGLSMDHRIIGYVGPCDVLPTGVKPNSDFVVDREYLSVTEWKSMHLPDRIDPQDFTKDWDCLMSDDLRSNVETSIPNRDEYYFDHVLLHLKFFCRSA
jgi:hypothetical protein